MALLLTFFVRNAHDLVVVPEQLNHLGSASGTRTVETRKQRIERLHDKILRRTRSCP